MIHAMIMAGGRGTRFWPLSRNEKPKQFLSVINHKTLLESTIDRVHPLIPSSRVRILGNIVHKKWLKAFADSIPSSHILFEPVSRNTAACIGWAATELLETDPEAVMVVLPADHYVYPKAGFQNVVQKAVDIAQKEAVLVTIGIVPDHPHVGYGYIEVNDEIESNHFQVKAFYEKPSLEVALTYLETGRYFWNSGMFIWKVSTILDAFKRHLPAHYEVLQKIRHLKKDRMYAKNLRGLFEKFDNISIDYGIMEKAGAETRLIPAKFKWSDIGSWTSLEDFWHKDTYGNAFHGKKVTLDSSNNLIYSQDRTIALVDVHDMIVVDSGDAIMILPKSSDQRIKDLVAHLPDSLL